MNINHAGNYLIILSSFYLRVTCSNYRISSMVQSDQGIYRCEATSAPGMTSGDDEEVSFGCIRPSSVQISVGDTHLEGYVIGSSVLWTCEAKGNPRPEYIWYRENNPSNVVQTGVSLT